MTTTHVSTDPARLAILVRRMRIWTVLFILGLVAAGITAIPLVWEVGLLRQMLAASPVQIPALTFWIDRVYVALVTTDHAFPFMAYGYDWLAFGHVVIAVAFIGALRDPVRNRWLFDFGLIASLLVIPWAMTFGPLRGIPFYWRLIDCSFGVAALLPLGLCRAMALEAERLSRPSSQQSE